MTPFRSSAFRQLWCSSLFASVGQGMERTATAWLALQIGAGALEIGLTFAVRMLPSLLLGLAAGTIADRADRPRQLLAVAGSGAFLMVAFSWLISAGGLQIWQVTALSFVAGCLHVFDMPARQALIMDTVDRESAARALALNALVARLSSAFGALGAGLIIALVGSAGAYLFIAGAYGLSALLVGTLRVVQEHRSVTARPPFSEAFRDAARLLIDVPAVRVLIVAGLACEIFAFSHSSAVPLFAQDVLMTDAGGLGSLNAALAIGGAIAVALLSFVPGHVARKPLLAAIFLIYGLAILGLAAIHELTIAVAVLLIIGFCAGAFDILQQTLIQLSVPDQQRGRAVGLWVFSLGSAPAGHLEMGLLIAILGVPIALLINGMLTVISAGLLLAYSPDYRWSRSR